MKLAISLHGHCDVLLCFVIFPQYIPKNKTTTPKPLSPEDEGGPLAHPHHSADSRLFMQTLPKCSKTRFNPNVPLLTSSLQIIITHIYISHFIDFLKKITESILKNGHFYDFWAVLARFGIFGPFFSFFWAILNIFWTLNIMGDDHGSI